MCGIKASQGTRVARIGPSQGLKVERWQRLPEWRTLPREGENGVKQKPSEAHSDDTAPEAKETDRNCS